jgi:hypothetical protein
MLEQGAAISRGAAVSRDLGHVVCALSAADLELEDAG